MAENGDRTFDATKLRLFTPLPDTSSLQLIKEKTAKMKNKTQITKI